LESSGVPFTDSDPGLVKWNYWRLLPTVWAPTERHRGCRNASKVRKEICHRHYS